MSQDTRFKTFLIFGAPGSGKGTQGKVLGAVPRFFHCACGDVFRSLDTRTEIGQEFLRHSSQGLLVPDDLTVRLWKSKIDAQVESHIFKPDIDWLVLDGIPRNTDQAKIMDKYVNVQQVFHLSLSNRDELARRLKKRALKDNRLDDANDDVIAKRLKLYDAETKPMLEYYDDALITQLDAAQHPAKVLLDMLAVITELESFRSMPNL